MKTYTFNIEKNNNSAYDINSLKSDIYNSFDKKYDWWKTLNEDYKSFTKAKTIINNLTDYSDIINALDIIYNYHEITIPKDNYDFIIDDTPVKIYDSYIQYGYTLIPIDNIYNISLYNKPTKKIIIDIVTKIKINK